MITITPRAPPEWLIYWGLTSPGNSSHDVSSLETNARAPDGFPGDSSSEGETYVILLRLIHFKQTWLNHLNQLYNNLNPSNPNVQLLKKNDLYFISFLLVYLLLNKEKLNIL